MGPARAGGAGAQPAPFREAAAGSKGGAAPGRNGEPDRDRPVTGIRYLLDENTDPVLRRELLRHERAVTVWRVGDPEAPSLGTLDPDILVWCEEHQFILVTNNRASMPVHLADHLARGGHVPGIFILNPKMTFGETIAELVLIWGASHEEGYRDRIAHLPVSE